MNYICYAFVLKQVNILAHIDSLLMKAVVFMRAVIFLRAVIIVRAVIMVLRRACGGGGGVCWW